MPATPPEPQPVANVIPGPCDPSRVGLSLFVAFAVGINAFFPFTPVYGRYNRSIACRTVFSFKEDCPPLGKRIAIAAAGKLIAANESLALTRGEYGQVAATYGALPHKLLLEHRPLDDFPDGIPACER